MNSNRNLVNIAFVLGITAIYLFLFIFPFELNFPVYDYLLTPLRNQLIPIEPFDNIAANVSKFLWNNKAFDLLNQAFVLVVAVICCLALLKDEGAEK